MWFLDSRKALSFSALIILIVFLLTTGSNAQMMTPVSGKMTASYTQQDSLVVSESDMHLMFLGLSSGTNASTGTKPFMDGAQIINMSFSDLSKGNGPHQGYIQFVKDGSSTLASWNGMVATSMTPEGAPSISFEGTFAYVKGTGMFDGIKGQGTYRGQFTSKTDYTVEWQGEYTLGK